MTSVAPPPRPSTSFSPAPTPFSTSTNHSHTTPPLQRPLRLLLLLLQLLLYIINTTSSRKSQALYNYHSCGYNYFTLVITGKFHKFISFYMHYIATHYVTCMLSGYTIYLFCINKSTTFYYSPYHHLSLVK